MMLRPHCGVQAQDWPQILGPNRSGTTAVETFSPDSWPSQAKPAWQVELGSGYAGAAVRGNTVVIPHRTSNEEHALAINLIDGQKLWETSWECDYRSQINPDNGPRCVPVIHQERVLVFGVAGTLVCLELSSGNLVWQRNLREEYRAEDGYFGAGSTPLVVDDLVVTCVGGSPGGIVAVDLKTGKTRWESTNYQASYASPVKIVVNGRQRILAVTRLNTVLLNPSDGKVLSSVPFGSRGPTVNAATPLRVSDKLYLLTANYGIGAVGLEVSEDNIEQVFQERTLLRSQYNSPVLVDRTVFGIDGREDAGLASLRALDPFSRKVLWDQPDFGTAHLINSGAGIVALNLQGNLSLIAPSRSSFNLQAATQLPAGEYRSLPALVGHRFLARVTLSGKSSRLFMFELP